MKLKRLGLAGVFLVGCAGSSATPTQAPAEAVEPEAHTVAAVPEREAVAHAMALYAAKDYDAAASAFETAYAETPDDSLLLARAQSLRLSGQCDQARVLYDAFLATATDPTYHNALQQIADDCDAPTPDGGDTQVAAR